MESKAIGIIITPPFIMISIIFVASGACCTGSAGAAATVLFRVSKVWAIYKRSAVMLVCIIIYINQNEILSEKLSLSPKLALESRFEFTVIPQKFQI
jgi:hypothetical protein